MSKYIFLDIDGTLVNYENQIPESARRAIAQARANGHAVFACTGRSRAEIQPELWQIELDGLIGGNGSYIEYRGAVLRHEVIPEALSHQVVDWLLARGLAFYLESNNGLFASPNFFERAEPVMALYTARKGLPSQNVRELLHGVIEGGELYRNDLNKISFILNTYQDHLDAQSAFPDLKAGTWGGAGQLALFGDLGVKNIDKGKAIQYLLAHLNASADDAFAFGDANVDLPMFEVCAVGVAMGNGSAELKAAADFITHAVDDDGIWHAFHHFHLI